MKEGAENQELKHPKLIVAESDKEYIFMGLTSHESRGHHKNIRLKHNPQTAYLRKEVRTADKSLFYDEILSNYNLSSEDRQQVIDFLENEKKK